MQTLLNVDWSKIPAPQDDHGADHIRNLRLPSVRLASTNGDSVDLSALTGLTVVYAYPMTGRPDLKLPDGWDMIPGARGCTPQSCSFRDHFAEFGALGADHLFGLSTQTSDYQREAVERLHLPFSLLSDDALTFGRALRLPTFQVAGMTLLKRLTMIISAGRIEHIFYPVFPPDVSARQVMDWLQQRRAR
jgi:peroxiredoxin